MDVAQKNYKLLKFLHLNKRMLYERQLRECQVDKIMKVLSVMTDIHQVRSELDLDLDLGDVMLNFEGFNNISYQCLDQEETECEGQGVEDMLTTAEKVPKKNPFSLMMSRKRAFLDEKKGPT